MSISVQGFALFNPAGRQINPLNYKTSVFEITNGTSISEIYDYFNNDPEIYILRSRSIPQTWGFPEAGTVFGYNQVDNTWERSTLPEYPIVLKWNVVEVERSDGSGTTPLTSITTPTNNTRHFAG